MVDQPMRTVTSPSIRSASSNSVRLTVWPLSAFSITIALNLATSCSALKPICRARRRLAQAVRLGGHRCGPRHRALDDRQVDDGGGDAKEDRAPPDHIVGTGYLEHEASEPDAEKAAELMNKEGDAEQHGEPTRAEHDRHQCRGWRD